MNTSKQALTIEECKELKALGFDMSDASMIYVQDPFFGGMNLQVNHGQYEPGDCYTYTLQDILEKLSRSLGTGWNIKMLIVHPYQKGRWEISCANPIDESTVITQKNREELIDTAFEVLKQCKKYKYI